ncbi:MAG: pyruvate kinase, partial [Candidatus Omnitrophota bacterium]
MVKTRIISTLGPASNNRTILRNMILSGMDVARLNFSHGNYTDHKARIDLVREINKKYHRHIKILQDLEGYRIRIGTLRNHKPLEIKKRQILWLTQENIVGQDNLISFDYQGALSDIKIGQYIYIDDGNIALLVKNRFDKKLKTEVVVGGILKEHKGINIPGAKLKFQGLTQKDKRDINFGIINQVDYIAQSFVRQ